GAVRPRGALRPRGDRRGRVPGPHRHAPPQGMTAREGVTVREGVTAREGVNRARADRCRGVPALVGAGLFEDLVYAVRVSGCPGGVVREAGEQPGELGPLLRCPAGHELVEVGAAEPVGDLLDAPSL